MDDIEKNYYSKTLAEKREGKKENLGSFFKKY